MCAFQSRHVEKMLQNALFCMLKMSGKIIGSFLSSISSQEPMKNVSILDCDLLHNKSIMTKEVISTKASVDSLYIKQTTISLSGLSDLLCSLKTVRLLHLRRGSDASGKIIMDCEPRQPRKQVESVNNVVRKNS